MRSTTETPFDVIIIGSGPGGATTALSLISAGIKVAIIEEGREFSVGEIKNFSMEEMLHKYRQGGCTVAMGVPPISYVEGRLWGGGSEINAGLYHRLPDELIEAWARQYNLKKFTLNDLEDHFKKVEQDLHISYLGEQAPLASKLLFQGAEKLRVKCIEVPRWFSGNQRHSMSVTYLKKFRELGGLSYQQTKVEKMTYSSGYWELRCRRAQSEWIDLRAKNIFMCAGAVQTPFVLQKNGIRKNVGHQFHLHPTVKMVAQFEHSLCNETNTIPVHQVKEFSPELSFGCSISSPGHIALALADHLDNLPHFADDYKKMAVYYVMCANLGKGRLRHFPIQKSALPFYQISPLGLQRLSFGLKELGKILFAAGATRLWPTIGGGPVLESAQDLEQIPGQLPRQTRLMSIHLFASCPMGENQATATVDSFGKYYFAPHLYISDGSILCQAPGVNPQGTIMALAHRNAQNFLENLK